MKIKAIVFFVFYFISIQSGNAQKPELLKQLYGKQAEASKVELLHELCKSYTSYSVDSFIKYINWGIKLTKPSSKEHLKFRYFKVFYLDDISQFDKAEKLSDSIIDFCEQHAGNDWVYCKILLEKSNYFYQKGKFKEAISTKYKAIKIAELENDTGLIVDSYLSTGWMFMENNKYKEAISWFEKGILLVRTPERQKKITNLYLNAASCYNNIGNYKRAMELVNLGLTNARNLSKWTSLANGLMIRSDIYINTQQTELAKMDIEEALSYRAKSKDTFYMASDMAQYSIFLASVNETNKGIALAQSGLKLIEHFNWIEKKLYLYQALAKNYKAAKRFKELSEVQEIVILFTDSIQKEHYIKVSADAATQYETEKKELTIKNQQLDLKLSRVYITALLAMILLGIPLVFYGVRKLKNRQKRKLNTEIENERRRISNDLHDGVGAYASSLYTGISSLESAAQESKVANLKGTAVELIEKLNQTVWVLDMESIAVRDLFDKYKNWFLKIIPNYEGMNYEFQDDIANNRTIKPQDALDLLNMLQEMTNNALKHSGGNEIRCNFTSDLNSFNIEFSDNGKGFDINAVEKGNGLNNLKKRADKLGGNLKIERTENGTKIGFQIIFK